MSKEATDRSLSDAVLSLAPESVLDRLPSRNEDGGCRCETSFDEATLRVDADDCDGDLRTAPECRRTVIAELADRDATNVRVRSHGLTYRYSDAGVSLLSAAGRFLELLGDRHERLAETAATDPLAAVADLGERVGPVVDVAVESGLLTAAEDLDSYEECLLPSVGMTISYYFLDQSVGGGPHLTDVRTLETGSDVRIYERETGIPLYVLGSIDVSLSRQEREILLDAYEAIAEGIVEGERAASRAIEHVSDEAVDPQLTSVLRKHTHGYGVLEDFFADPRVSDVYVTAPVTSNPVRVVVDGQSMETNVSLSPDGARALASRVRRTSGRSFSRANPTVDATADLENGTGLRVAGVTEPVSAGVAFAFRERADDRFTLPALVANGTMTATVAGFLSIAIERNGATLIAGTRGAGKTTLLGTLLYELAPATRTVAIEDTPELPLDPLQSVGRDVQALRTGSGEGPEITAAEALRTALRLGDGALVVGEIRGEEARVLYEAMRVGANANAVLGTIHGDGAEDIYERVVSDLGVEPSSFAVTDLVVTVQAYDTPDGRKRRVSRIEEVMNDGEDVWFAPLFEIDEDKARPSGRIDRGESRFVDDITGPGEEYADIRQAISERADQLESLAGDGRTNPREVAAAYARQRS